MKLLDDTDIEINQSRNFWHMKWEKISQLILKFVQKIIIILALIWEYPLITSFNELL